jgi:hypothetical protein
MFQMLYIYIYIYVQENEAVVEVMQGDPRNVLCDACCGETPGFCVGCGQSWLWSYKKVLHALTKI